MAGLGLGLGLGFARSTGGGGGPPPPASGLSAEFYDDFASAGALDGRTGWTWTTGAPSDAKSNLQAIGGVAKMSGNTSNTDHFPYTNVGAQGQFLEVSVDLNSNQQRFFYLRGSADSQDAIRISMESGGQLGYDKRVGGSMSSAGNSGSIFLVPASDVATYRFEISEAHVINVYRNGEIYSIPRTVSATVPAGTGVGFSPNFFAADILAKDFRSGALNLTALPARSFTARNPATNVGLVPFSGIYKGTLVSLDYEVRDLTTDAVVQSRTAFVPQSASAGTWTGTASIPSGHNNRLHVDYSNDDLVYARSTRTAVGPCHVVWGQSEAGSYKSGLSANPFPGNKKIHTYDNNLSLWVHDVGNTAAYDLPSRAAYTAKILSDLDSLPHGIFANGVAARFLSSLIPGEAENLWNTYLVDVLATAGISYFESTLLEQGVAEAWANTTTKADGWLADFANFETGIRSLSGDTNLPILVAHMPTTVSSLGTCDPAYNKMSENVMSLHVPANKTYVSHSYLGITRVSSGDQHANEAGGIELAKRYGLSIARWVYGSISYDGRGPLCGTPTRSGATITIPVDLNGATSLSGTSIVGFVVGTTAASLTNGTSPLTITSVNVSGSNIVIVLASDPGAPVYVASHRGHVTNESSMAIGTYANGMTIPVFPMAPTVTTT